MTGGWLQGPFVCQRQSRRSPAALFCVSAAAFLVYRSASVRGRAQWGAFGAKLWAKRCLLPPFALYCCYRDVYGGRGYALQMVGNGDAAARRRRHAPAHRPLLPAVRGPAGCSAAPLIVIDYIMEREKGKYPFAEIPGIQRKRKRRRDVQPLRRVLTAAPPDHRAWSDRRNS